MTDLQCQLILALVVETGIDASHMKNGVSPCLSSEWLQVKFDMDEDEVKAVTVQSNRRAIQF